jgi:DNA-binding transcriptional MerR regulator
LFYDQNTGGAVVEYLRNEVEQIIGVPTRRIKFYTDQGVLPGFKSDTGRGYERKYSKTDIFILSIVRDMAKDGFPLSHAKALITLLVRDWRWSLEIERYSKTTFTPFAFVRISDNEMYLDVANIEPERVDMFIMVNQFAITTIINLAKIFREIKWTD